MPHPLRRSPGNVAAVLGIVEHVEPEGRPEHVEEIPGPVHHVEQAGQEGRTTSSPLSAVERPERRGERGAPTPGPPEPEPTAAAATPLPAGGPVGVQIITHSRTFGPNFLGPKMLRVVR